MDLHSIRKDIVKERLIGMFAEKTFEHFYEEFTMIEEFLFFGSYATEDESFHSDMDILIHPSENWLKKHSEEQHKELVIRIHSFLTKQLGERVVPLDIKLRTGIYGEYSGYTYRNDKKEPVRYYFHQGIRGMKSSIKIENDFLILNNW